MDIKDLDAVFRFEDAVKAVENLLEEAKRERDVYSSPADWDSYYRVQERVEVIEEILTALKEESSVLYHVDATDQRNGL